MNKKQLSERDICTKFITPSLRQAGWDEITQLREEVSFTRRTRPSTLMGRRYRQGRGRRSLGPRARTRQPENVSEGAPRTTPLICRRLTNKLVAQPIVGKRGDDPRRRARRKLHRRRTRFPREPSRDRPDATLPMPSQQPRRSASRRTLPTTTSCQPSSDRGRDPADAHLLLRRRSA